MSQTQLPPEAKELIHLRDQIIRLEMKKADLDAQLKKKYAEANEILLKFNKAERAACQEITLAIASAGLRNKF